MKQCRRRIFTRLHAVHAAAFLAACAVQLPPIAAAQSNEASPFARAVTTVKVGRSCFNDTLQVTGTVVPRNEVLVRSDREGFQVSQVLVENGDTVVSGQVLVRLRQPDAQRGSGDVAVQ
jgi:HlyD family secretion protein